MPLPWFRVDTGIGAHDKIMRLTRDPHTSPANRYRAAFSYVCAIGWSVGQETDGYLPTYVLDLIHGTPATAKLLVTHQLWEPTAGGWQIRNFAARQQTSDVSLSKREQASKAARIRWERQRQQDT